MARLPVIDPDTATGESKQLFARVKSALGVIPNMTKVMANSPALLQTTAVSANFAAPSPAPPGAPPRPAAARIATVDSLLLM